MKLSLLKSGDTAVITKVNGHGSFRKRLIEMGFITGKVVKVILNAPLKDPIEYEILGYRLSLRRKEAEMIEVLNEEEAKLILKEKAEVNISHSTPVLSNEKDWIKTLEKLAFEKKKEIRIALVGNPNCGKTSLFNIASGSHEHVGNYGGVTVEAKEGIFKYKGYKMILVDLPGTYSLSAYSPEEVYVRKNLIETIPDLIINVVDASNLERNLYLTTQIIDLNLRVVVALNMYDELEARGDILDLKQLSYLLGLPICPTVCKDGRGVNELFDTVIDVYEQNNPRLARHIHINHGLELEKSIDKIKLLIQKNADIRSKYSTRFLAIKYLENDSEIEKVVEELSNRDEIIATRFQEQERLKTINNQSAESSIVDAKYAFIQGALAETYERKECKKEKKTLSDKIDAWVTNKWLAFPIFIILLYLIFNTTFIVGNYPMEWIEAMVRKIGEFVGNLMNEGVVKDLVVDGVIAGVGSVLVFLPNIMILYFFISLMEDSGYMSRAAFIVDKLMHKIGLHGKSFIPMIMGFGCNVPAIMATRSIESPKSRLITIAIIPFMACTGRLPIFVLIAGAFMPKYAALSLLGIYLLGVVLAIITALILKRFIKDDDLPFVMELPPYRMPTGKAIWRHTWEKGKQYLEKMATTILIGSVAIWVLGYFPRNEKLITAKDNYVSINEKIEALNVSGSDNIEHSNLLAELEEGKKMWADSINFYYEKQQENSYIGILGKAVAPALDPLGFSWKMDIGLLTGVVAKELVVSSLGVMYSQGTQAIEEDVDSLVENTQLQKALVNNVSIPAAIAFMIFVLLYFPCIATFVAIKNETGKWIWAIVSCAYTMVVAWVFSFIAYSLSSWLLFICR